jgi:hypothetical protein
MDGEQDEGFESHSANGDAIFGQAGADERQQALTLRVGPGIVSGGNENVAAGLPLFHRKSNGDVGEQVGIWGENAGLALADEASHFGGAAMVEGIVGAEFAEQFADGRAARFCEEVSGGGSSVAGLPWPRAVGLLRCARSGRNGESLARFRFRAGHRMRLESRTV